MNEPSPELAGKILRKIEYVERRRLIYKAGLFGAALLASLGLAFYGIFAVQAEAYRSGFLAFTSLFFSDFSATLSNFSDFSLSIIESFPFFSATVLLAGVFFAIWSASNFINDISLMRRHIFQPRV